MGAGWSQDEAPQSSQEPRNTISQSQDIHYKATETTPELNLPLPHAYEDIVKDADSPVDKSSTEKLYRQLHGGVFLNQKRKKYWVDEKSKSNCFMLFARNLSINWSDDKRYWHWPYLKETNDVFVDIAELLKVCWLEVNGKFETRKLSPGVTYEVIFVIMLKEPAYGWEAPVNFTLVLPDGNKKEQRQSLKEKPRGQWIEIPVGQFDTSSNKDAEIEFSLYEYQSGKWKRGLVIKGVTIRPKS
ncbi:protein PHLOEM PROTEIN 2-LIKE A1-like [Cornus florida]|uniref:protein PHLOEM PROTEIN 2-LIKE A1-like n=1 Tax=Cornus florida TaxID=4283 RepID=UPI00289790F4|nr:protein PHLOEM PROTEIN 2-LIKE A1-like [Cornus florida]